jgi:hypothetical protein
VSFNSAINVVKNHEAKDHRNQTWGTTFISFVVDELDYVEGGSIVLVPSGQRGGRCT